MNTPSVYNSISFDECILLYDHSGNQDAEHFCHSRQIPALISN